MESKRIHLINSRSCVFLDVVKAVTEADDDHMFKIIRNELDAFELVLKKKGIDYSSLRSVLSPATVREKKEILLVFEAESFGDYYGGPIFDLVFPLINKKRNHVIKCGDLLFDKNYLAKLNMMDQQITYANSKHVNNNCTYFLIYLNNITLEEMNQFNESLKSKNGYLGYCDLSFCDPMSYLIAYSLVQICVQVKDKVIISCADSGYTDDVNVNETVVDFDKYGFRYISIGDAWYNTFLSYKIITGIADEGDISMSLNSITNVPTDLKGFTIDADPNKHQYILNHQGHIIDSGLADLSREEFLSVLNNEISFSTIFDLEFMEEYKVDKFGTIFEHINEKTNKKYLFIVVLKYLFDEKRLDIITMY